MSPVELQVLQAPASASPASISRERYEALARRARLLSWLSLAWMTVEGGIAITAGIVASSVALVGFGLDSVIEGVASVIIIWRFSGHRVFSADAERRAQRLVAVQFFLLAPYVAFESVKGLAVGEHPEVSWVGIALATGSVVLMPMFGTAKERLADRLGSAATKGEGRQNMLCAYLAGALFFGLLGNALLGAWWLDPTVGLLIAAIAVKEGLEAWGGEGCGCVASPLEGVGFAAEGCADDCCAPAGEVPSCGLDHDGLAGQRGRYAEIGRSVVSFDRTSGSLRVELSPSVDHRLVEEAVSVERGCCPFFEIDFDPPRARLRISVAEDAETPALDAIAHALGLAPDAARSA